MAGASVILSTGKSAIVGLPLVGPSFILQSGLLPSVLLGAPLSPSYLTPRVLAVPDLV